MKKTPTRRTKKKKLPETAQKKTTASPEKTPLKKGNKDNVERGPRQLKLF
jgi:hypothetical protein